MPHRLALLIFLQALLAYATTPTPGNTHAPVKLHPVAHADVFIPLKEWKRQRLQDIESRVRKAEQKRVSPRPRLSAVCKPRARLLAFLARLDVCPPSASPTPALDSSEDDLDWVSAKDAYDDVNLTKETVETVPPKEVQPAPKPAVSPLVVEEDHDSHLPEKREAASMPPSVDAVQNGQPSPSVEPDELTGRIEDYIPKLPNVLPKVIPKVGEIVKSLKEVSLAYTSSGDTPADTLNPTWNASVSSSGNSTGNSTLRSHHDTRDEHRAIAGSENESRQGSPKQDKNETDGVFEDEHMLNVIVKHNNDSGVKEKPFNYASIDAGARVLAFSNGVVGASNVIQGSIDKYMLAPCAGSGIAGSRFVDLELSEEVILESIETGNFEYYSSSPRKIAILGASTYPPKKWNVLGIFDFANVKTLQRFQIEKRGVTRYLRIIFAGKQGTEYYCPISTVRAFGKNLLTDLKEVLEKPAATRKPLSDSGGGSKSRTEKESDKAKNGNTRTVKKLETERQEKCSGDSCKNTKDMSTSSHSPAAEAAGSLDEEKHDIQSSKVVDNQSVESETAGNGTDVQDEKADVENNSSRGDGSSESDTKPVGETRDDEQSDSDEPASVDDSHGDENQSSDGDGDGDGDHVSEDDQVVIDALRSDTLSPVDGDDNIFRKVTRMLRLLELNQTLTNQYIDTQLSKFAAALSNAHSNSRNASERVEAMQGKLEIIIVELENRIEELTRASVRRDILLCILLVCVAFLLGTHWILWSAISGWRIHEESGLRRSLDSEVERIDRMLQPGNISPIAVSRVEGISSEGPSPAGKRKKRKGKRPFAGEHMNGGYFSASKLPSANGLTSEVERVDGRSMSSFDISSSGHRTNGRRRFGSSGGTFDVLGQLNDQ